MGIAATLFFCSNDTEKQTLHRRITPSDDQFSAQQDRWNDLAEHLTSDLRDRSAYSIRTWLQGSYKFGTQIRPVRKGEEFDIDLGVYFQWSGDPDDGEHTPEALKEIVQDSLLAYDNEDVEEVAPPKPRCGRIRFKNDFHIDIPAYHLEADDDLRSLATDDGWENSDPKAIYIWFRDSFDDTVRAKVRRQVKYLKAWAGLKFREAAGRPSSILLTVLVAEAATELGPDAIGAEDDTLRDIVELIVDRLEADQEVPNPVDVSENLVRLSNDQVAEFVKQLKSLLDVANRATDCDTAIAAADIWQEAFEHLFPMPEPNEAKSEMAKWLPAAYATPEVEVIAVPRNSTSTARFTDVNKIGPIPRDCDIYFKITNAHQLPANSVVTWTVRNEGMEAENTNDLGHLAGIGLTAKERSAYRGVHYMDCAVKVGGKTISMRRIPVSITGLALPRRNPVARPAYVQLRGRR